MENQIVTKTTTMELGKNKQLIMSILYIDQRKKSLSGLHMRCKENGDNKHKVDVVSIQKTTK